MNPCRLMRPRLIGVNARTGATIISFPRRRHNPKRDTIYSLIMDWRRRTKFVGGKIHGKDDRIAPVRSRWASRGMRNMASPHIRDISTLFHIWRRCYLTARETSIYFELGPIRRTSWRSHSRLLRQIVNGAQKSKQIEKRNEELVDMERLKGTHYGV